MVANTIVETERLILHGWREQDSSLMSLGIDREPWIAAR